VGGDDGPLQKPGRWAKVVLRPLPRATGISDRTIRNGIKELDDPETLPRDRQRRPGAGRASRETEQPELVQALEALVDAGTRGDPMTTLRWTCHSTRELAKQLQAQGFRIGSTKVGELLRAQGYSLQANRKTVEGKQHPDRDAQFQHIAARMKAFRQTGHPAISIDTKKKETPGNMKNPGRICRKKGEPRRVKAYDFPGTVPEPDCGAGFFSSSPMKPG